MRRCVHYCKNKSILLLFFSVQKTSIALIHLKPSLAGSFSDLRVSLLLVPGTKMYALPTNRRMKVMRFVHTTPCREISGMESVGREEDMQKTATHIVPLEILDDAPRTLLRPSKLLLFFPFLVLSFTRDIFYEWLAFSRRFVLPSPNGATRKRLYHNREIFRQTSPSVTREPARNFAVYGELINAVCTDEKMLFAKFIWEFPG